MNETWAPSTEQILAQLEVLEGNLRHFILHFEPEIGAPGMPHAKEAVIKFMEWLRGEGPSPYPEGAQAPCDLQWPPLGDGEDEEEEVAHE